MKKTVAIFSFASYKEMCVQKNKKIPYSVSVALRQILLYNDIQNLLMDAQKKKGGKNEQSVRIKQGL